MLENIISNPVLVKYSLDNYVVISVLMLQYASHSVIRVALLSQYKYM